MENSFSLLGNVEGDASAFLERLAAEAKDEDQKHKRSTQQFVRTENGEGKRGQGAGLRRYARNNGQLFENGHGNQRSSGIVDGWRRNNGGGYDYQNHQGGASWRSGRNNGQQFGEGYGNQKSGGSVDGWKRNNGGGNGYKQGYGRGDGGVSGRGRGLVGAPNGNNGAGKNSQIVEGDQQGEIQEQGGDKDGDWEKVVKKQQRNNGNGYWRNNSRPKEASGSSGSSGNHSTNGDNDIGNVAAAIQVSKDDVQDYSGKKVEEEQAEEDRENIQEETEEEKRTRIEEEEERIRKEARRKAWEEEQKKMTLKQYENKLLEERKKTLEDLKTEERKVIPDKDFESMQLVGKKKEDSLFTNQDTENGKLKKKDNKVVKSMSIDQFLKPAKGENSNRGIQGRGRGEYQRGNSSQQATYHANGDRFPQTAGGKEHVANFNRPGGPAEGGSSRRGSFHGRGGGGHQEGTDRANGDRFGREHTSNSNSRGGRGGGGGGGGRGGSARGSSADAADPTAVDVPAIHDSTQFPHLGAPRCK